MKIDKRPVVDTASARVDAARQNTKAIAREAELIEAADQVDEEARLMDLEFDAFNKLRGPITPNVASMIELRKDALTDCLQIMSEKRSRTVEEIDRAVTFLLYNELHDELLKFFRRRVESIQQRRNELRQRRVEIANEIGRVRAEIMAGNSVSTTAGNEQKRSI